MAGTQSPQSPPKETKEGAAARQSSPGSNPDEALASTDIQSVPKAGPSSPTEEGGGILPASHWQGQSEAHEREDDADSAIGESIVDSTTSLSSTILQYRTIHGRTFHSERGNANYWGSNDEQASEGLDIVHHVLTLALDNKLFLAPLEKDIKKVLDVGTGTGIWAIDFADAFPDCEVIGTDISPMQPSWVPPNVRFEMDDCTQPWTYQPDSFDYVHIRWLLGSIPDWNALFAEAYKSIKPGGWLESFDPSAIITSDDGTVHDKTALGQWGKFFVEGSKQSGRSFTVFEDELQLKAMKSAGFVDIQQRNLKVPIGPWPRDPKMKEMGRFSLAAMEADAEGFVLFTAATQGWSKDEIMVYLANLRRELRSGKYHSYYWQKVVWGRKPEAGESA